jgi:hypothetical protein
MPTSPTTVSRTLNLSGIPPFLIKIYAIVDDPANSNLIHWDADNSFCVENPQAFSTTVLPKYFKHSNFCSFVRQLSTYGFRKVDDKALRFAHEKFRRGEMDLLREIPRRKSVKREKVSRGGDDESSFAPPLSPQATALYSQATALSAIPLETQQLVVASPDGRSESEVRALRAHISALNQKQQAIITVLQHMHQELQQTKRVNASLQSQTAMLSRQINAGAASSHPSGLWLSDGASVPLTPARTAEAAHEPALKKGVFAASPPPADLAALSILDYAPKLDPNTLEEELDDLPEIGGGSDIGHLLRDLLLEPGRLEVPELPQEGVLSLSPLANQHTG